jgi:hypothetical protein
MTISFAPASAKQDAIWSLGEIFNQHIASLQSRMRFLISTEQPLNAHRQSVRLPGADLRKVMITGLTYQEFLITIMYVQLRGIFSEFQQIRFPDAIPYVLSFISQLIWLRS